MNKIIIIILFLLPIAVGANSLPDADKDGVPDDDEIRIYKTDPNKADTDNDGYSDWVELNNDFSPLVGGGTKLDEVDTDQDKLNDKQELSFKTDISNPDTDGDGYKDGDEVNNFFNPLSAEKIKLNKKIEINIKKQELKYYLSDVLMGKFLISSGARDTTPRGNFKILNKQLKAWSSYGLWMPYWMAFAGEGRYGIHELPIWPNGYREGEDHLGKPVSHGCVRLGIGAAEFMYNWSDVGTPVFIY